MAAATDSIPAPTRRLLRAAGPCRVLTTDDVLAHMSEEPSAVLPPQCASHVLNIDIGNERDVRVRSGLIRNCHPSYDARVFRQHDTGALPRVPQGFVAIVHKRSHRRPSKFSLTGKSNLRS